MERSVDSKEKIKELEKESEEKELLVEYLENKVKEEEEKVECHLEALEGNELQAIQQEMNQQAQEIQQLKQELYLANKSLPTLPKKKKI
nr:11791_t:CDS:2 [Entrophospora candida]